MAKDHEGINGAFRGKVGTVVGTVWRGKNVMRSIPVKSKKPLSEKQLLQLQKLKVVTQFLAPFRLLMNQYYPSNELSKNGTNLITSYALKKALHIQDQSCYLIYSKLFFAVGVLPKSTFTNSEFTTDNVLKLHWEDMRYNLLAQGSDQLIVIGYNQALQEHYINKFAGIRDELTTEIALPKHWKKEHIHLWYWWINQENELHGTSEYLSLTFLK